MDAEQRSRRLSHPQHRPARLRIRPGTLAGAPVDFGFRRVGRHGGRDGHGGCPMDRLALLPRRSGATGRHTVRPDARRTARDALHRRLARHTCPGRRPRRARRVNLHRARVQRLGRCTPAPRHQPGRRRRRGDRPMDRTPGPARHSRTHPPSGICRTGGERQTGRAAPPDGGRKLLTPARDGPRRGGVDVEPARRRRAVQPGVRQLPARRHRHGDTLCQPGEGDTGSSRLPPRRGRRTAPLRHPRDRPRRT